MRYLRYFLSRSSPTSKVRPHNVAKKTEKTHLKVNLNE